MKNMSAYVRGALVGALILALVCCGLYPLAVWGIAQLFFTKEANGSLIVDSNGIVWGSEWLGQGFTSAKYFHPRPSAAGNGYDAAHSSGSNEGPTSKKLSDAIAERIRRYREENRLGPNDSVPADAVTASGSGLDPHISLRNAEIQALRVAQSRRMSLEQVHQLIRRNTLSKGLGFLGNSGVHVLMLNRALDQVSRRE